MQGRGPKQGLFTNSILGRNQRNNRAGVCDVGAEERGGGDEIVASRVLKEANEGGGNARVLVDEFFVDGIAFEKRNLATGNADSAALGDETEDVGIDGARAENAVEAEEIINLASLDSALEVHDVHAEDFKKLAVRGGVENENAVAGSEVGVHGGLVEASETSLCKSERGGGVGAGKNLPDDSGFDRAGNRASGVFAHLLKEVGVSAEAVAHLLRRDVETGDVLRGERDGSGVNGAVLLVVVVVFVENTGLRGKNRHLDNAADGVVVRREVVREVSQFGNLSAKGVNNAVASNVNVRGSHNVLFPFLKFVYV